LVVAQILEKGIMPEVLPEMIKHLFNTWKLHRLEAVVETGNEASSKLLVKLGFVREGILREAEVKNGKRITLHMYSLLKTDL
jgi:ribosomal-protein-alanine N-acetyltransferase